MEKTLLYWHDEQFARFEQRLDEMGQEKAAAFMEEHKRRVAEIKAGMAEHMLPFLQIAKDLPPRNDPTFEKSVFEVLLRKAKEFEAFEKSQKSGQNQSHYINHMRNAIVCNFRHWSHDLDQTKWWKKLPKTYVLHGSHGTELHIKRASKYVLFGERYLTHHTTKYPIQPGSIPTNQMLYLAAWQVYFDYALMTGLSQFAQDLVSYHRID